MKWKNNNKLTMMVSGAAKTEIEKATQIHPTTFTLLDP